MSDFEIEYDPHNQRIIAITHKELERGEVERAKQKMEADLKEGKVDFDDVIGLASYSVGKGGTGSYQGIIFEYAIGRDVTEKLEHYYRVVQRRRQ